jgi:hypothetical protein
MSLLIQSHESAYQLNAPVAAVMNSDGASSLGSVSESANHVEGWYVSHDSGLCVSNNPSQFTTSPVTLASSVSRISPLSEITYLFSALSESTRPILSEVTHLLLESTG